VDRSIFFCRALADEEMRFLRTFFQRFDKRLAFGAGVADLFHHISELRYLLGSPFEDQVRSPSRAAIRLPMSTVGEPFAIASGGPTHVHISVTRAAGCPPIKTVGMPGGSTGPPTCGTGGVPGVAIGQVCMSPTRAAGGIGIR
jgi:hypothetical protein